jgi:uncharacterized protein YjbJ (UPF0337 family)
MLWFDGWHGFSFIIGKRKLASSTKRRNHVNKLTFKGSWNEVAGKLKQKYANISDDDLLFKEGKDEELLGRLQKKLGQTKEEIRSMIKEL